MATLLCQYDEAVLQAVVLCNNEVASYHNDQKRIEKHQKRRPGDIKHTGVYYAAIFACAMCRCVTLLTEFHPLIIYSWMIPLGYKSSQVGGRASHLQQI